MNRNSGLARRQSHQRTEKTRESDEDFTLPTHSAPGSRKLLVTVEEMAQMLSIGRPKAWQLVMRGEVVSVLIGRSRRIAVSAIEAYIERLMLNQA